MNPNHCTLHQHKQGNHQPAGATFSQTFSFCLAFLKFHYEIFRIEEGGQRREEEEEKGEKRIHNENARASV